MKTIRIEVDDELFASIKTLEKISEYDRYSTLYIGNDVNRDAYINNGITVDESSSLEDIERRNKLYNKTYKEILNKIRK